jgi:hypothetical protein
MATMRLVDEITQGLVKRGFFDKTVFNRFVILTLCEIQTTI